MLRRSPSLVPSRGHIGVTANFKEFPAQGRNCQGDLRCAIRAPFKRSAAHLVALVGWLVGLYRGRCCEDTWGSIPTVYHQHGCCTLGIGVFLIHTIVLVFVIGGGEQCKRRLFQRQSLVTTSSRKQNPAWARPPCMSLSLSTVWTSTRASTPSLSARRKNLSPRFGCAPGLDRLGPIKRSEQSLAHCVCAGCV